MQVQLQDLHKGDEILIARFGELRKLTLLQEPTLKTKAPKWASAGAPLGYKAVKCHSVVFYGSGTQNEQRDIHLDLNGRVMWLINKANI